MEGRTFYEHYLLQKEYPVPYSVTCEIVMKQGQTRYKLPNSNFLQDKLILGLVIRSQTNPKTRKSREGRVLVSNAVIGNSFISLSHGSVNVLDEHPLDHFLFDPANGTPGEYTQLVFDQFVPEKSYINIVDPSVITPDESIELTWIYAHSTCVKLPPSVMGK